MPAPELPGFYFDEDKGKYFRIQPDHKLPIHAKHAVSNVAREQRLKEQNERQNQVKRRRVEQRSEAPEQLHARHGSTRRTKKLLQVKRALLSNRPNSITSYIYQRELGLAWSVDEASAILATEMSFIPAPVSKKLFGVVLAIPHPEHESLQLFYEAGARVISVDQDFKRVRKPDDPPFVQRSDSSLRAWPDYRPSRVYGIATYGRNLVVSTWPGNREASMRVLGTCSRQAYGYLTDEFSDTLRIEPSLDGTCLAAQWGRDISFLDAFGPRVIKTEKYKQTPRSMTWLKGMGGHILAADEHKKIWLADRRCGPDERTVRFKNAYQVTGLKSVDEHQLLVADNFGVKIFDLRWPSKNRTTLSFDVRQHLAEAKMAVSEQGIVAVYGEQSIELLSLKTGLQVACHQLPGTPREIKINDVSWLEDGHGVPYVQICSMAGIHHIRMIAQPEDPVSSQRGSS